MSMVQPWPLLLVPVPSCEPMTKYCGKCCHFRRPSSVLEDAERLVSGSVEGCFDKFYSDAYPLIIYDEVANTNTSKLP
ncbi:hypothetical protein NC651_027554 [Populus alba x Populus x berolinensis]|nr:hypothetical protein NC651_027554 [Populus alba x Populus x berolinensis]